MKPSLFFFKLANFSMSLLLKSTIFKFLSIGNTAIADNISRCIVLRKNLSIRFNVEKHLFDFAEGSIKDIVIIIF